MTLCKTNAFFMACLIMLAGCSKSQQELLKGHWECNGQGDGAKFTGSVEYVSNGSSNVMFEMSMKESGTEAEFDVIAQGTWELNKNELLESFTKLTITRFVVDGRNLPPEQFPQQLKEAIIGTATGSEIIQLDERVLLTKNGGSKTTCSRQ
ncbi:hypothetical protein [Alteromonas macleodii]|uniref:hypothetical protein n=1 Tax=Alteromonas macleodii TaxID=28108 RepID=UPI0031407266